VKHAEAAQLRATISSVLSADPGKNFSTEEVAQAVGQSPRTTGQILGGMARGGLINGPLKVKGQHKFKFWAWPTNKAAGDDPPPEEHKAKPHKAHPPKEVELEAFGITIVVGRNEKTGRLRITLEG